MDRLVAESLIARLRFADTLGGHELARVFSDVLTVLTTQPNTTTKTALLSLLEKAREANNTFVTEANILNEWRNLLCDMRVALRVPDHVLTTSQVADLSESRPLFLNEVVSAVPPRDERPRTFTAIFVAPPGQGKTYFVKALIRHVLERDEFAALSVVICAGNMYQYTSLKTKADGTPDVRVHIYEKFEEEKVRLITDVGSKAQIVAAKQQRTVWLVIDDASKKGSKEFVDTLFQQHRQKRLGIILVYQSATHEVTPQIKTSVDLMFFSSLGAKEVSQLHPHMVLPLAKEMKQAQFRHFVADLPSYTWGVYFRNHRLLATARASIDDGL